MLNSEVIDAYEKSLLGAPYPPAILNSLNSKHYCALIAKHVFEINGINSPEQAKKIIDSGFVKKHKLEPIYKSTRIIELLENDYDSLVYLVFPETIPSKEELVINMYKDILSGKRKNFPSKYFNNDILNGEYLICVLFNYLCKEHLQLSKENVVATFSATSGNKVLSKYKLKIAVSTIFDSPRELMLETYPNILKTKNGYEFNDKLRYFYV